MAENYSWQGVKKAFRNRLQRRTQGNLGIIAREDDCNIYRNKALEKYDSYYENRQYDHLAPWEMNCDSNGDHIPVRHRKPRIQVSFAKTLSQRLTAKLIGKSVFPKFTIPENPMDQEFVNAIIRESNIKMALLEPTRRMINSGSCFIRYWLAAGVVKTEYFESKYCYPTFQENGELESVEVKYVFTDTEEKDAMGNYKRKWYKLELNMTSEIMYDNPDFVEGQDAEFTEVDRVDHNLGFVQGEWMKVGDNSGKDKSPDGYGIVADITDFIDELCYSFSQSSQAIAYNQDPQLAFKGMDAEDTSNLIRSVTKSWNLGRTGEAAFVESNLNGVEKASELRDKVRLNLSDISRIVLIDPEKTVGNAQSAKAMETLYGPLVDLVDELRPMMEKIIKNLVIKISVTVLMAQKMGIDVPLDMPQGYQPTGIAALEISWPPIFQQTMNDLQLKIQVANTAKLGGMISPETAVKWIAKDFDIEDINAELVKISEAQAAQAALNPFGGF